MESVELQAVIEAPWYEGDPPWPWPVSIVPKFSRIRLSGKSSRDDVGLFFGALQSYNELDWDPIGVNWTSELEAQDRLLLAGGLMLDAPGREPIRPGCCAGIEAWAEFWNCPEEGSGSPWWGHDPDPYIERTGDEVLFWQSGGISTRPPEMQPVRVTVAEYRRMLDSVQRDLLDFLTLARGWLIERGVANAMRIIDIIDESFAVTNPDRLKP